MASQPEHRELLGIIHRAAGAAVGVIRAAAPRARSIDWQAKAPTDFVSEVDLAAEASIREVISRELPEAAFLGEESADGVDRSTLGRGLTVVADPLDGTTNFLHGFPEYATSIAVLRDGRPVAGIVVNVPRDEWFTATAGGGTHLASGGGPHLASGGAAGHPTRGTAAEARPCRVSPITDPMRSLIGTGFPFKEVADIPMYQAQMAKVMAGAAGLRRPGAASLDLASVAAGRFEAFWENYLSPWDFGAGQLLVTEAGGVVTDLAGAPLAPFTASSVMAGSPAMHAWLARTLAQ